MTSRAKLFTGTALAAASLAVAPAAAQTTTSTTTVKTGTVVANSSAKPLKPQYRNMRSFYRNMRSFWGDVNPFYRNMRSFWGDVDPFYRNMRSFWGTVDPAKLAASVNAPIYSGVGDFWETQGTQWHDLSGDWSTAGDYATNRAAYAGVAGGLTRLHDEAKTFWGSAVAKQTGKSFEAGFSNALFARYGIDPDQAATLASLSVPDQQAFFLDWYDGLMNFSGTDHVDHWMRTANWNPGLTQVQGGGKRVILGLVDQFSAADADTKAKLVYAGGTQFQPVEMPGAIHGAGVLSLINANHDGKGVMGIAPNAAVAAYNPFDAQGGADWAGVRAGVTAVKKAGANIVNLSLGIPGKPLHNQWAQFFKAVDFAKDNTLYVIAAGNDGVRQDLNINMKESFDSTYILVGSVDPNGKISGFSNTPGDACLTEDGDCKNTFKGGVYFLKESGLFKYRFIVAPGEMILVSDGKGGVSRQSGTSVAAPLVSGAAALIMDRWPWFKDKPRDVATMILASAKDLGEKGPDAVYGMGLLDIEASQSPLDFGKLTYTLRHNGGAAARTIGGAQLKTGGLQASWARDNMYLTAFEHFEQGSRDFLIPLSSTLHGQMRNGDYFQDFVYNRMSAWIAKPAFAGDRRVGFTDSAAMGGMSPVGGWSMAMTGRMVQGYADRGGRRAILNTAVEMTSPEGRYSLSLGHGDGATALGGMRSMGLSSDFDPYSGGANPLLGFASGGAHLGAKVAIAPDVQFKAGHTRQTRGLGLDLYQVDAQDRATIAGMERYTAEATNVGVDYRPASWLTMSASATRLVEPNAFMGVRTTTDAFGRGTVSTGVTVGADASVGGGVSLFGSATGSRSAAANDDAALRIAGAYGTAFQAGVAKQRLLGKSDQLRLSVAKPLGITRGDVELTQLQVVNRETGEQGYVTERFDINGGAERLVVEGVYGASFANGRGEVSLFGRGEVRELDAGAPRLMLGGQFRLGL